MAISQGVCTSFKGELFQGIHNFNPVGGDVFKMALYTSVAILGPTTMVYNSADEVVGPGYTAGGRVMVATPPATGGTTGFTGFQNVVWPLATITAAGALIYNSTKGNKAVGVVSFGGNKTSTLDDFTVAPPADGPTTALLRIN